MQRAFDNIQLAASPALLRYNPTKSYSFLMPGLPWRRYTLTFIILGSPGLIFLITWRGGIPSIVEVLYVLLLAVVIVGLSSQLLANKVILAPLELIIKRNIEKYTLSLHDIEDVLFADRVEEVDNLELPPGHYPMEFETRNKGVVVLVLRDGTRSRSSLKVRNNIVTKYVTLNVAKPHRFFAFLRMRV